MIPGNIHETAVSFGDLRHFARFDTDIKRNGQNGKKGAAECILCGAFVMRCLSAVLCLCLNRVCFLVALLPCVEFLYNCVVGALGDIRKLVAPGAGRLCKALLEGI